MESQLKNIKVLNKNIEYFSDSEPEKYTDKDINKKILEEILSISSKILEKYEIILYKINSFDERLEKIEKKIEFNLKNNEHISYNNLKELKKEDLNLNKEDTIKALKYRDYRSVVCVFRNIYKNKTNLEYVYPIKIIGKRSFEYYNNMKWNSDSYGNIIINILCLNIQNLFIKYNNYEDFGNDDFIMNQEFICNLSEDKYKKSIFKSIIEEIRLNEL
jgi:hypothetical protein